MRCRVGQTFSTFPLLIMQRSDIRCPTSMAEWRPVRRGWRRKHVLRALAFASWSLAPPALGAQAPATGAHGAYRIEPGVPYAVPLPLDADGRFARASSAVLLPGRKAAALDPDYQKLVLVSLDGASSRVLARADLGAAAAPRMRLAADGNDVLLLDNAAGRAATFPSTADVRGPSRIIDLAMPLSTACRLNGDLVVLGHQASNVLHWFDRRATRRRSAGPAFHSNPVLNQTAASMQGLLQCIDDRVVFASGMFPIVRAADRTGREQWRFTIPDFVSYGFDARDASSLTISTPAGGADAVAGMFRPSPGVVALQVIRARTRDGLETWYLDDRTGRVIGRQQDLPLVEDARDGTLLLRTRAGNALNLVSFIATSGSH